MCTSFCTNWLLLVTEFLALKYFNNACDAPVASTKLDVESLFLNQIKSYLYSNSSLCSLENN